jgi:hypothetical protein
LLSRPHFSHEQRTINNKRAKESNENKIRTKDEEKMNNSQTKINQTTK